METIEKPTATHASNCKECGNPFSPKRSAILHGLDYKFCSDSCRSSNRQKGTEVKGFAQQKESQPREKNFTSAPPTGIHDPAAAWIIKQLERDRDKLESENKKLQDSKEAATTTIQDLKNQILKMEHDAKLKELEKPEVSTLEGLGNNPVVQQLVPFLGPVLARIAEKAVAASEGAITQQVEGLQEEPGFAEFKAWFKNQSPDIQKNMGDMLQALNAVGSSQGELALLGKLLEIQNYHLSQYVRKAS